MSVKAAEDGTSSALTVDQAVQSFLGMLSGTPEDQQSSETQPTQESPASESEDEIEPGSEPGEDSEDASAETEEPEEQVEEPQIYTVKVDGQEVQVTLEELQKGYSRQSDYTRKTQAVSAKDKELETERVAVRGERERYAQYLGQLEHAIKAATPTEPDWNKLQQELPPAEFAAEWARWSQHKAKLGELQQEHQRAENAVIEDRANALRSHLEVERGKLFDAIPEWKDGAKAKSEKAEMVAYAKAAGYSEEELGQVIDHRAFLLLRKAMLFDKAKKAAPAARQTIQKVKTATPGPGQGNKGKNVSGSTRAMQRLAKTGKVDHAAEAFFNMLQEDNASSK